MTAEKKLSKQERYEQARDEFERKLKPLRDEYGRKLKPLRDEHWRTLEEIDAEDDDEA